MNFDVVNYSQELFDHYLKGGEVENFGGKGRARRDARRKKKGKSTHAERKSKRQEKIEGFKNKVKGAVSKLGSVGVLIPFKKVMTKRLNELGVNTSGLKLDEIAVKFFDRVIKKNNNYEVDHVVPIPPSVIAGVVQGILGFFKNLVKRKKEGAEMSAGEEKMAGAVEKVAETVDDAERDYTEETIGEMTMKYLPYILVAGVAIYFITKK